MPRHLIGLDIDGTTITHEGELREVVREAVRQVREAGHHVVIATGRGLRGTLPILDRLGIFDGYAVCSNGALTLRLDPDHDDGYEIVGSVTFDPAPVLTLLREHAPTALVGVEEPAAGFKVSGRFPENELDVSEQVVPWEELMANPVSRVTLRQPEASPEEFLDLVESIGLHGVNYAVGWSAWLDISPEGVSKASGLEPVRELLGVDRAHTVVVGDQRNDLEMFAWAGRAVAMANAPDEVRAAATEVTGHVLDDGLVPVLHSLL